MKTNKEAVLVIRDEEGKLVAVITSENRHQVISMTTEVDQDEIEALMNKLYDGAKIRE